MRRADASCPVIGLLLVVLLAQPALPHCAERVVRRFREWLRELPLVAERVDALEDPIAPGFVHRFET